MTNRWPLSGGVARWIVVGGVLAVVAAGCGRKRDQPREAVLSGRRIDAMQQLLARPTDRGLIDREQSLLVIHENVIQRLLTAALPFDQDITGQLRVRLEAVRVEFNDGLALLHLKGTAGPPNAPGEPPAPPTLNLELEAAIESITFEAADGILRARARVLAVESTRTGAKSEGWRGFVSDMARLGARNFEGVNYDIEIPIRVADRLSLPDLASEEKPNLPVAIEPASIPLDVSVGTPVALFDRLWIPVNLLSAARLDSATAHSASATPERAPRSRKRPVSRRAAGDTHDLESTLRDSLDRRSRDDRVLRDIMADSNQVTVATSERLIDALLEQVASRYLDRVDVDMDATIQEEETGSLRVGTPIGTITAGNWSINLRVERLRGRLKAGRPRVDVGEDGLIALKIPTRIESGGGRMTFDFAWKPAKLVSILCRSFRDTVSVTALVLPQEHDLAGVVRLVDAPSGLSLRTAIRRDRHPIAMTLTESSWATVRASLARQDRMSRCGAFLNPDDALEKLKALGQAGIKIRMPERLFPAVTLPTRVSRSVMILSTPVALVAGPNRSDSRDGIIWTSAEISLLPASEIIPPESRKGN